MAGTTHPVVSPPVRFLCGLAPGTRDSKPSGEHEVVSTSTHGLLVPCQHCTSVIVQSVVQSVVQSSVQFDEQNEDA